MMHDTCRTAPKLREWKTPSLPGWHTPAGLTLPAADLLQLDESRLQEQQLRDITRKILTSTELEQLQLSLQLHDEIIQTLLGIQVRLLALEQEAASGHAGFNRGLITTQRLVKKSIRMINRFARKLNLPYAH